MSEPDDAPVRSGQLFELRIFATGEVRDADGNLLNQDVEATSTYTLTEQEAVALIERKLG